MVAELELSRAGKRTKVLLWTYVISGLLGLLMTLWLVIVLFIFLIAGGTAVQSLPVAFIWPWLPLAAVAMFAAKLAMAWSYNRENRAGRQ